MEQHLLDSQRQNSKGFIVLSLPLLLVLVLCTVLIAVTLTYVQKQNHALHECRIQSLQFQNIRMDFINKVLKMNTAAKSLQKTKSRLQKSLIAAKALLNIPLITSLEASIKLIESQQLAGQALQQVYLLKIRSLTYSYKEKALRLKFKNNITNIEVKTPDFPLKKKTEHTFPEYETTGNFIRSQIAGIFWKQKIRVELGKYKYQIETGDRNCVTSLIAEKIKVKKATLVGDRFFSKHSYF